MANVRSIEEIQKTVNQLDQRVGKFEKQDFDLHGRKVRNASDGIENTDYVTLGQLKASIGTESKSNSNSNSSSGIFNFVIKALKGLITNLIYPPTDSTTAIEVTKADGTTTIITLDSTNERIGIKRAPTDCTLEVAGSIVSTAFDSTNPLVKFIRVCLETSGTPVGHVLAYDGNAAVFIPLKLRGSDIYVGISGGTISFFDATPASKQTLNSYTTNAQGGTYTSTPAALGQAATLSDLNTLRVAYENLRASYDDLRTKLKNTTLVG